MPELVPAVNGPPNVRGPKAIADLCLYIWTPPLPPLWSSNSINELWIVLCVSCWSCLSSQNLSKRPQLWGQVFIVWPLCVGGVVPGDLSSRFRLKVIARKKMFSGITTDTLCNISTFKGQKSSAHPFTEDEDKGLNHKLTQVRVFFYRRNLLRYRTWVQWLKVG